MIPLAMSPGTIAALATVAAAIVMAGGGYLGLRGSNRLKSVENQTAQQAAQMTAAAAARGQDLTDRQVAYEALQEDLASLRTELAAVKVAHAEQIASLRDDHIQEINMLRTDLSRSQRRERVLETYTWDLRRFIERKEDPPPPDWPAALENP